MLTRLFVMLLVFVGLAFPEEPQYYAYDAKWNAWIDAEVALSRLGKTPRKKQMAQIGKAEEAWREYAAEKRRVYEGLLEEAGGGKDRFLSAQSGLDAAALKPVLLAKRAKAQQQLENLRALSQKLRTSGTPEDAWKASRLSSEITTLERMISALDSAYVQADLAANEAPKSQKNRKDLIGNYDDLVQIYRRQLANADAEDRQMQTEFARLRDRVAKE